MISVYKQKNKGIFTPINEITLITNMQMPYFCVQ